jgi:hypothetical protein
MESDAAKVSCSFEIEFYYKKEVMQTATLPPEKNYIPIN